MACLIYQEEGQAEAVELFASSTACIICFIKMYSEPSTAQRERDTTDMFKFESAT